MESNKNKMFENSPHDPDDDFQKFWRMEKGRINGKDFFSEPSIEPEFTVQTSVDWESLRKIAKHKTELERVWEFAGGLSKKKLAFGSAFSIVAIPFFLMFIYDWAIVKIGDYDIWQNIIGWSVLLSCVTISGLVLGTFIYILFSRSNILRSENRKIFGVVGLLSLATAIVFTFINIYKFTIPGNDQYESIAIQGTEKLVAKEYYKVLKENPERLAIQFDFTEPKDSIKTILDEGPEYLNALALKYEKRKEKFQAELAYHLASKSDPLKMNISYQTNLSLDLANSQKSFENIDTFSVAGVDRYISKIYPICFTITNCDFADSIIKIQNEKINNVGLLNAKAIYLEYIGQKGDALRTYKYALNHFGKDPVTLVNARKFVGNMKLDSIVIELTKQ